jgi:hypothetical protein
MMLAFVSSDVHPIGSVKYRGWCVTAWRTTSGYRLTAVCGATTLDTHDRDSIPEAWRVLHPRLC